MASKQETRPHIVCIPAPLQGHINPMLKLAKILHSKGFFITFVNTEFNHQRLLRSQGSDALSNLHSFRFETIPDGLPPPENHDASQDIPPLAKSVEETCLGPFKDLLTKVSVSCSPVKFIVSDLLMGFTHAAAAELGIPEILVWTSGAASLICYDEYQNLLDKGLMPLKEQGSMFEGLCRKQQEISETKREREKRQERSLEANSFSMTEKKSLGATLKDIFHSEVWIDVRGEKISDDLTIVYVDDWMIEYRDEKIPEDDDAGHEKQKTQTVDDDYVCIEVNGRVSCLSNGEHEQYDSQYIESQVALEARKLISEKSVESSCLSDMGNRIHGLKVLYSGRHGWIIFNRLSKAWSHKFKKLFKGQYDGTFLWSSRGLDQEQRWDGFLYMLYSGTTCLDYFEVVIYVVWKISRNLKF